MNNLTIFSNENLSKIKSHKKTIIFISIIILLPITLLFITKLVSPNAKLSNLNNICIKINDANSTLNSGINDKTIHLELSKSNIETTLSKLLLIKSELSNLEVSKTLNNPKKDIEASLLLNIDLLKSALTLSNSQSNESMNTNLKLFKDNLSNFSISLKSVDKLKLDKLITDVSLDFFENFYVYFDTLINLNLLNDINLDSKNTYIFSLNNNIIEKFNGISEDLRPAINNIKNSNRSFLGLLQDISKKKNVLSLIEENYYKLVIPDDIKNINVYLDKCLSSYKAYISNLENAIDSEISKGPKDKTDNFYKLAFENYDIFSKNLSILKTEINKLKKSSI